MVALRVLYKPEREVIISKIIQNGIKKRAGNHIKPSGLPDNMAEKSPWIISSMVRVDPQEGHGISVIVFKAQPDHMGVAPVVCM